MDGLGSYRQLSEADEIAEIIAMMADDLKAMMRLNSREILSLVNDSLFLTAKPTPDLDAHAALGISALNASTHLPEPDPKKDRGKNLIVLPEAEPGSIAHLKQAREWMQHYEPVVSKPYIFVESSSTLFSPPMADMEYQRFVTRLFRMSQKTHAPLVGCVYRPLTTDLIELMKFIFPYEPTVNVSDAALLHAHLHYGQRTAVFCWELDDQEICFVYLKTNPDIRPARIEFPKWIFEAGQHEELFKEILLTSFLKINPPFKPEWK